MRKTTITILAAISLVGCSSPASEKSNPRVDASYDATPDTDLADQGSADAGDDPDAVDPPFEFGFEAVPFGGGELTGLSPAALTWDGAEHEAQFLLIETALTIGTLSFEVDGSTYSYRLQGQFDPSGEVTLSLTERQCSFETGTDCATEVPQILRDSLVYDIRGRHNGTEVIFAPPIVRDGIRELAPNFAFRPPTDTRMVPNDGFKPAQIPNPASFWVGRISFVSPQRELSGDRACELHVQLPTTAYVLTSMSCDDTSYEVGGDPGPDPASLQVNENDWTMTFEWVEGGQRWTVAGQVGIGTFVGVIVKSEDYGAFGNPFIVPLADMEGLFYFEETAPP